jgi:hypothetical protein
VEPEAQQRSHTAGLCLWKNTTLTQGIHLANHPATPIHQERRCMHKLEPYLSPNGLEALKLVRAIRALPEFEGTYRAERSALKNINTTDLKRIAVILADEESDRG